MSYQVIVNGESLTPLQAKIAMSKLHKPIYSTKDYIAPLGYQLLQTFANEGIDKLNSLGYSGNFMKFEYRLTFESQKEFADFANS